MTEGAGIEETEEAEGMIEMDGLGAMVESSESSVSYGSRCNSSGKEEMEGVGLSGICDRCTGEGLQVVEFKLGPDENPKERNYLEQ